MGCYQCGSEEGTNTRMCPNCTASRLEQRGTRSTPVSSDVEIYSPSSFVGTYALIALCGLLVICLAAYFLLLSPAGPGIAMEPHERILAKCRAKMQPDKMRQKILDEKFADTATGPGKDVAIAMQGAMAEMMGGIGEAVCEAMAQECRNNPDGRDCQSMLRHL